MPAILNDSWGLPVPEYFDNMSGDDVEHANDLLEYLDPTGLIEQSKTSDTIPRLHLQAICQLSWTPTYLCVFKGSNILPSLMRSLRSYCKNNKIFDYEYGYHWIEALTLAVAVGVLMETKQLKKFIKKDSGSEVLQAASELIVDALPEGIQGMRRVFGASVSHGACLPSIGGLTEAEVRFLIGQLWADRKTMFKLQGHRHASGWSYVLLTLWHCARFTRDKSLIAQIRHLALRCVVGYDNDVDRHFVFVVAKETYNLLQGWRSEPHTVDVEDSSLILQTYIDRLTVGTNIPLYCLQYLISWIAETFNSREHNALSPGLAIGNLTALWISVQTEEEQARGHEALITVNQKLVWFATQVFSLTAIQVHRALGSDGKARLLVALDGLDIVSLIGQILLRMRIYVLESDTASEGSIDDSLVAIDSLGQSIRQVSVALRSAMTPSLKAQFADNDRFLDWIKTRAYIQKLGNMVKRPKPALVKYIARCRESWYLVGEIFDYSKLAAAKCASPVCCVTNTSLVCARCQAASYCSASCQKQ
ncbi:hypothetical protein BDV93DRAFT_84638 [Ceratobasidium sp. AG-I]|nr:hypothetical protein BDV93DRAFT_84638 [Ceratobasidium sp. AG-I]